MTSKVEYPGERMAIDMMGLFPKTELGNQYILVVCDYFTRWTEAFPLPNQEAFIVARVFVDEFVCTYGVPVQLHTDQDRNFEPKLTQEICRLLQINKTGPTPYIILSLMALWRHSTGLYRQCWRSTLENTKNVGTNTCH